jgi:Flp pilus assembly protein TadG
VLIPFLTLLFGLIQYGLYFYSAQAGSQTTNSAARQLSVGNCQDSSALTSWLKTQLGAAAAGAPTDTVTYANPDGTTPDPPAATNVAVGGTVTVKVSFPTINMHFPFVPFLSDATVTRTVTARVEDTHDDGCGV